MLMRNRTRSTDGGSIVFGAIGRVSNFVQTSSVDRRMGNRGWASVTIGAIARQNDTPCFWPQPRMALRLGFFRKLGPEDPFGVLERSPRYLRFGNWR
jgi:hypothetical protein